MFTKCEIYDNKFNTKLYSSKFVSCLKIVAQAILSSFGNLILSNDIELRDLHEDGSKLKKKKKLLNARIRLVELDRTLTIIQSSPLILQTSL